MKFFKNDEISKKGLAVRLVCLVLAILMLLAACGEDTATATKKKKKVVIVKKPASSDVEDTSSDDTDSNNFNNNNEDEESEDEEPEDEEPEDEELEDEEPEDEEPEDEDPEDEDPEEDKPEDDKKNDSSKNETSKVEEEDEGEDLKKKPVIDHSFRESTVLPQYTKLVWSDEFDGTALNTNNWSTARWSWDIEEYVYIGNDPELINVKDGTLNTYGRLWFDPYNSNYTLANCPGLHTTDLMRWRYGYIECCARMAYKPTSWSALWTQSDTFERDDREFMIEIDIIEIFGSYDTFYPNVHKWYTNKAQANGLISHTQDGGRVPYTFKNSENLYNEFHVYGFEWTPKKFGWYVDGEQVYGYDFDRTDGYTDMSSFVKAGDCMWYIIGDGLYNKSSGGDSTWNGGGAYSEYPAETQIDWIRLYQDPNESQNCFQTADTIPEDRKKNVK